jgi:hypothetical protein
MGPINCCSSSVLSCTTLTANNPTHKGRAEGVVRDQQKATFIDSCSAGCALTFLNTTVLLERKHNGNVTG